MNWVLKRRRPRRKNPGSAAEGDVRPPNMRWFRMDFWLPKVELGRNQVRLPNLKFGRRTWGTLGCWFGRRMWLSRSPIKGSQTENGRVSPHSRAQVCSCPPLVDFRFSFNLLWFSWVLFLVLKSFKLGSRIWSLETPELVSSTSPRFGSHQPSISKRLV